MKVQGITWHASVVPPEKFAAQKELVTQTLGVQPALEMEGLVMFQMPNGTIYEIYLPKAVPPYGYNEGGVAFGWRVEDIDKASAELAAAGCELLGQISRFPELRYTYRHFRAPDGRVYGINEQK